MEQFPVVGRLALNYLNICCTSAECERVFSGTGNVVTARRANLAGPTVEALTMLRENAHWFWDVLDTQQVFKREKGKGKEKER